MKRKYIESILLMMLLLAAAGAAWAQINTADINGKISDETGAVIPGATITAKNIDTDAARSSVSTDTGDYAITLLPPGRYEVSVELSGFAKTVQKDVTLNVGTKLTLNFTLKPAALAETVVVQGEAPLVEVTKSEVGGVVTPMEVQNLPIRDRNFANIAILIPGVRPAESYDPTKTRVGNISIGGGDGRNVDVEVDGASNKDNVVGGLIQNFTTEGIQEFQVLTNRFTAESGRSQGGVINVITKSGTNEFHGSGFYFLRHDKLNARNFFEREAKMKAPFRRQQFGGSAGGPIKRDRLFFFGATEWIREPGENLVDPNLLREVRLIPGAQPVATIPTPFRDYQTTGKVDLHVSDKQTMFWRFGHQKNSSPNDQVDVPGNTDLTGGNTDDNRIFDGIFSHNYVLSPTKVNIFSFHFQDFDNRILGVTDKPNIIFPSGANIGANVNVPQKTVSTKWQFRDDLSIQYGRHQMKTGVNYIYLSRLGGFFFFGANGYSVEFFDDPSCITNQAGSPSRCAAAYPQGFATPGAVKSIGFFTGDGTFNQKPHQLGLYFQDDFKVTPRLTLNLGLRWDANIRFLNDQTNNRTMRILQRINHTAALGDLSHQTTSFKEFQPRVGFAWDPTGSGRSVIRGGYGIYYDQVFQNLTLFSLQQSNPAIYQQTLDLTNSAPGVGQLATYRFGADPLPSPPSGGNTDIEIGGFGRITDPNIKDAYSQQWSIGYQQEFARNYAFEATYIHVLGIHEPRVQNINPKVGGGPRRLAGAFQQAFGIPNRLEQVNMIGSTNRSRYDALNTQLRRRFSNRIVFQMQYILSKSQSWGGRPTSSYSGNAVAIVPEFQFLPGEFGPTIFDERHRFVFSGVFDLPGGIQLAPLLQWSSPRPYTILAGFDVDGDGRSNIDRGCIGFVGPGNCTVDKPRYPVNSQRGGRFKDGSKAPGRYFQTDLRATKVFKFTESMRLSVFFDFFNLFNTDNFGNSFRGNQRASNFLQPSALFGAGRFGRPVGTSFNSQFGLRFQW